MSATDNCDNDVDVTFKETKTDGSCPGNYVLTRTWTATDDCGNSTSGSQVITVRDNSKPVLVGVPSDIAADCDDVPAAASGVSATDNCDNDVDVTFKETKTDGACPGNYVLTRTWTATDDCGNSTSGSQVITVRDNSKPVLVGVPSGHCCSLR